MASLFIGVILLIAIEKGPVVLRKGQSEKPRSAARS